MKRQHALVVRNRKNAMFYKTLAGACIADVVTSVIATTIHAGASVFDYFKLLQRDKEKVKANPLTPCHIMELPGKPVTSRRGLICSGHIKNRLYKTIMPFEH